MKFLSILAFLACAYADVSELGYKYNQPTSHVPTGESYIPAQSDISQQTYGPPLSYHPSPATVPAVTTNTHGSHSAHNSATGQVPVATTYNHGVPSSQHAEHASASVLPKYSYSPPSVQKYVSASAPNLPRNSYGTHLAQQPAHKSVQVVTTSSHSAPSSVPVDTSSYNPSTHHFASTSVPVPLQQAARKSVPVSTVKSLHAHHYTSVSVPVASKKSYGNPTTNSASASVPVETVNSYGSPTVHHSVSGPAPSSIDQSVHESARVALNNNNGIPSVHYSQSSAVEGLPKAKYGSQSVHHSAHQTAPVVTKGSFENYSYPQPTIHRQSVPTPAPVVAENGYSSSLVQHAAPVTVPVATKNVSGIPSNHQSVPSPAPVVPNGIYVAPAAQHAVPTGVTGPPMLPVQPSSVVKTHEGYHYRTIRRTIRKHRV